jgi:flagellar M-ring protein FliF
LFKNLWESLGRGARIGLVSGVAAIVAVTVVAAVWLLRADYQVLFSDLTPQDAGAMVAELDRMKIPYKLGDGGTSILVDKDVVHKTRIKLLGKDLPLHGTVGFELFNNADFGMTEFAQKVNYQRALQGEISRTILSLAEIDAVRVHLALPEEGLFKHANSKPKASITLTMKRGQTLRPEQVAGIQRLVSAAVPGIATQDVTIVDQHGVALTRVAQGEGEGDMTSLRLELKKETENYLAHKADAVLERAFGTGQAMASVDVTLDMDSVRVTSEDVVGAPAKGGQTPTGVIVKERETLRDSGIGAESKQAEGVRSGSSQHEVEYQVGRRVEQIISTPGSVRRVNIVAVVRKPLDAEQSQHARDLIAAAVGASPDRGDTVVVQTLSGSAAETSAWTDKSAGNDTPASAAQQTGGQAAHADQQMPVRVIVILGVLLAACAGLVLGMVLRKSSSQPRALSERERQAALAQVRGWIAQSSDMQTNESVRVKS